MSNFVFLQSEWFMVYEAANRAEVSVYSDPRISCFYARRALELAIKWVYKHDATLQLPYRDDLSALLHETGFKDLVGQAVFFKARAIKDLGNLAVHSAKQMQPNDALVAVKELFHVCYWLARTYARREKPQTSMVFDESSLPKTASLPKQTIEQLQRLEKQLSEKDEKLSEILADKAALNDELNQLRSEISEAKKANTQQPDTHNYSEAETRDSLIDILLKEVGWFLDKPHDREFEVAGMPNKTGKGFVDYVLWGDDGKPLALVEAKRTRRDARVGQEQARIYADSLEQQFGQRPVIFYSNGYEHWMWDDVCYPHRRVQGFYKKAELEWVIQKRASRKPLASASVKGEIADRYYQTRAIRRICESFEKENQRKALVVMATGAGKTRTIIALVELLMRCNWAKRVLFLADRVALVNQTVNAFKKHLPDVSPVNLVTEKEGVGRVFVSTYPTMMGLIDEIQDEKRSFGIGHFDLVIIDEAHRSVYQKYRAIFDYFDSFLVGLTATPKDEVDRNTYNLFDLERGVPTDAYTLEDAVRDKFLVPAKAVDVPLRFQREGIRYEQLSEEEKEEFESMDWGENAEDLIRTGRVEAEAINKWLFNTDTVDKVLAHLMTRGQKVAGGDRLGKTIVFAKNQHHADFIAERFNLHYPQYKGVFARVITFKTEYAQSLIDQFSDKDKDPHIAISVDMLDTGIDVPEVVNLVFFKSVRSKTKFLQMIGRGTRLCPDLFGPGQDKKFFYIFDYCGNLQFFSQNPETTSGNSSDSLGKKLFQTRLELIGELQKETAPSGWEVREPSVPYESALTEESLCQGLKEQLHAEVKAMNPQNFVVRSKQRFVEKYAYPEAWVQLTSESLSELVHEVAGLPSEIETDAEETKRFDLLVFKLQLSLLRIMPEFVRLREKVMEIASALEEKSSIPVVNAQMTLIQEVQTDEWWQDITVTMLEGMRRNLRKLVVFIEKHKRQPIYTQFEDEMGVETEVVLPGFQGHVHFERFREKTRAFLQAHQDHLTIHKLKMNKPLTFSDLLELERIMEASGLSKTDEMARAVEESKGLGLFVRSLVGLDREAAKQSFSEFLTDKTLNASQIEFINLIVDYLTEHGVMKPDLLYESPFVDISPQGPNRLFTPVQVNKLLSLLEEISIRAVA